MAQGPRDHLQHRSTRQYPCMIITGFPVPLRLNALRSRRNSCRERLSRKAHWTGLNDEARHLVYLIADTDSGSLKRQTSLRQEAGLAIMPLSMEVWGACCSFAIAFAPPCPPFCISSANTLRARSRFPRPPRLLKLVLQPFEGRRIGFAMTNDEIGRDSRNPF